MNLEVERISADEFLVRCDTSGWSHKPSVTLAGPPGAGSPERKIEDSPQVNGLYSVKAQVKTAEGVFWLLLLFNFGTDTSFGE